MRPELIKKTKRPQNTAIPGSVYTVQPYCHTKLVTAIKILAFTLMVTYHTISHPGEYNLSAIVGAAKTTGKLEHNGTRMLC